MTESTEPQVDSDLQGRMHQLEEAMYSEDTSPTKKAAPEFNYAPFWKRFLAYQIDALIVMQLFILYSVIENYYESHAPITDEIPIVVKSRLAV